MAPETTASKLVFGFGLLVWIVAALTIWATAPRLGHDEAQYALAARYLIEGEPARWFHLSVGMNAIAIVGVLAGGSEHAMRFVPMLFGIGFVLAAGYIAVRTFGRVTAAWVVAVLAGSHAIMKWSVELLSDLPAATAMLAAIGVIITEIGRDEGPRWRILWISPLLAAAFYLRYGSSLPIAIICVTALIVGFPRIRVRPVPVIAAAVVFLVLLLPHAWSSIKLTGSPLGLLLESAAVPQHAYAGEGLVTYVTRNPFVYYGALLPFVLIAGALAVFRRCDRRTMFLWLVGVGDIVALGLNTHAQLRYILLGVVVLAILGVEMIRRWIVARPLRTRTIATWIVGFAIVGSWAVTVISASRQRTARNYGMRGTLAAASAIRAHARGRYCHVMGIHDTQLEWYSGCSTRGFMLDQVFANGEPMYIVNDHSRGKHPDLSTMPWPKETILDLPGTALVVRLYEN